VNGNLASSKSLKIFVIPKRGIIPQESADLLPAECGFLAG
jgi:hypothetical protein